MKKIFSFLITVFFITVSLWSMDYGLVLNQNGEESGIMEKVFSYKAGLIPWFSAPLALGDSSDLYFSAGLTLSYDNEMLLVPEIHRTEFSWRWKKLKLTAGRMQYTAPFEHIASGLFDGLQFFFDTEIGTFNTGIWYTGFLYKKSANILITPGDYDSYNVPVKYNNFFNTYFASKRLMGTLGWEHPAIAQLVRAKFAYTQQSDLNKVNEILNSHYFSAKAGIPVKSLLLELGGVFQVASDRSVTSLGFAWDFGFYWNMPLAFPSRLSFNGFFSRERRSTLENFIPITAKSLSEVIYLEPAGIASLSVGYTARPHEKFSFSISTSYFMHNPLATSIYNFFLENELYGRLVWSPASDIQFSLGGGIYIPSNWKIRLGIVIAVL